MTNQEAEALIERYYLGGTRQFRAERAEAINNALGHMTATELAEALGVTSAAVYKWSKQVTGDAT